MCGIAGIVGCAEPEPIERMTRVQAHRGPDSRGVKIFPQEAVALGHNRLSILDLSERGHQPMSDVEKRFWITYNGEIYNFQEIRRQLEQKGYRFASNTDTEVILSAYREWGPECLKEFNGMFAFAIWDTRERTLFAARDRLGVKPFYYHYSNCRFSFASEIKALLESGLVPKEVDYPALHTPELYQAGPLTGFKHIQKLMPGHYLLLRDGTVSLQRYWKIEPREVDVPYQEAFEQLDALVNSAIQLQMISDVPVGAFLSGGLDSSLIVALMQKHSGQPVSTFTIRYAGDDQKFERMPDDSRYAKEVASLFNCRHTEFTIEPKITDLLPKLVWHLGEPLSDPAALNTYLISKSAREQGIIVMLTGVGADEIFGGYRTQLACQIATQYRACVPEFGRHLVSRAVDLLPSATASRGIRSVRWAKRFLALADHPGDNRFALKSGMSPQEYRAMFSWDRVPAMNFWEHSHVRSVSSRLSSNGSGNDNGHRLAYLTRMCLADTEIYLPDHNLTYNDRATMAAGVEGRPPFTDHRVVEFMFGLPPHFRIRRLTQKYLLKKVAEKYLPRNIIYRPKAPFGAPLRAWIRGGLSEMVNDYLNPETLKRRGIYNPAFIAQALQDERDGREDNAHLIWRLLCNEIWLRTFFSN
jgi:asparagine synthase (glutamine-hydrolysing)